MEPLQGMQNGRRQIGATADGFGDEDFKYAFEMIPRIGVKNVEFLEGEAEQLPFPAEAFDAVISNGVIDLIPDKDAVFAELHRVLAPGGRIQVADVTIQQPVSDEGRRNIDLWTG